MTWFRRLLLRPHAAALLLAAALMMKLLVPAGFMPMAHNGSVTILPCDGFGPQPVTVSSGHSAHGMHGGPGQSDHHKGEQRTPCEFSVLAGAGVAGSDFHALAAPLPFAALMPEAASLALDLRQPQRLRPPQRGPPSA